MYSKQYLEKLKKEEVSIDWARSVARIVILVI